MVEITYTGLFFNSSSNNRYLQFVLNPALSEFELGTVLATMILKLNKSILVSSFTFDK
jgi:hypothetical protein